MLPKHLRLSYKEGTLLKKTGIRFRIGCIEIIYQKNQTAYWQFLIIVPKRVVKLATGRNRFKRIIREHIRLHASKMVGGGKVIVTLTRAKSEAEVLKDLENVLQKLN